MRNVLALWLCVVLSVGQALARDDRANQDAWDDNVPPVFSHLTPAEGLPYPVALGLAQDGKGFIWAATPGGVARWDGYRMTVFRHDDDDPNSLPDNIVTKAFADEYGRPWFSTVSGVVVRFDEASQGFVTYRHPQGDFGRLNGICGDGKGGVWTASRQGAFRLDVATRTWQREEGIPKGEATSILIDRGGRTWVGTAGGGIWKRQPGGAFVPVTMPVDLGIDAATALYEDVNGKIWFGTRHGAVGYISADGGKAVLETVLERSHYRVTAFAEPRPGVLWVAEYGGGIREFHLESKRVRGLRRDPTAATSLGDDTVTDLLVDRSGLVWAGTLRGIDRHIPTNQRVVTVVNHRDGGLTGHDVRSVAAADDGGVWLGFRVSGLALVEPGARLSADMPATGPWPEGLPGGPVQAVADTADGRVWAGLPSGLFEIDIKTGRVTPYAPLKDSNIQTLYRDHDSLWAGGSMGLVNIPLDGGIPRFYRSVRDDVTTLSDNSVQAIHRDRAQRLWVGTQRGFDLLEDAQSGRFRRVFNDPGDSASLPSDIINRIAEDRFGRLWLATGNGIGIFDPEQEGRLRFTRVGRAQGLGSGTVLSVIEGEGGLMVAGTGDGLSVLDPETLKVRTLGPPEGLEIKTFWAGSATRMKDGTLVLGGFGGMAVVRPTVLPSWDFRPPVVVTDIRVGGQPVLLAEKIEIPSGEDSIQVDYSALDYSAPERNRYAYRLDKSDWVYTDAYHRTASYTNLPPGVHKLELMGSSSIGKWGEPLELSIHVLPAWYQTAWFRSILWLSILGGGIGLILMRKAYHQRRETELNQQVIAKTAEAEAARQWALAGEEHARRAKEVAEAADAMKSRFLAIIGHEIRTPLNGLLGMLQILDLGRLDEDQRQSLSRAKQAGDNLRLLVESVLEYGREGSQSAEITLDDMDMRALAQEIAAMLRPHAEAKGLALILEVLPDEEMWIRSHRVKLSRILLNLIGNAVKFTDHGSVTITVAVTDDDTRRHVVVTVTDTGIGVPPDMSQAIFSEFIQADDSITRRFGGVGLGLALSRRMATHLGGELVHDGTVANGSRFRLDFRAEWGAPPPAPTVEALPDPTGSGGLRVLVVDDEEINLRVAERMLTHMGHHVSVATCGHDAVAAMTQSGFDVVLMDVRMPDMDGMEAALRIRNQETALGRGRAVIIAMTADLNDEVRRQCLDAGMDETLAKPVRIEDLQRLAATARPVVPSSRGLDLGFLAQQVDILGPREMIRLVRLFQKVSRDMITSMEKAAQSGDRDGVQALAHRLRSASGSLGMMELGAMTSEVEAAAKVASAELTGMLGQLRAGRLAGLKALAVYARSLR
ncbi:hybrid sensor histidine kinase/response regulator [Magnetospirillum gryphiswaldense]|uniref:hybrid sensor histidine kinase/response regulator n=1 Tax=Magnetospirillum gryphiswaldense TaxID=55518 RepID=UPI000D0233D4|nr:hybrid sensor histidine kinase/response regulator [Magnetospirillum gryphiswaldense]AVM74013.1 Autoinducer 2 sensor kinase/phosphatase LuxQ [Magnetospirillum gryphiswaldense MSR-1]AVM77916.1 Autoinducer 2 sensor kinase/phosphatase LuxQ [Magnetospirillum gryphiswaldense]